MRACSWAGGWHPRDYTIGRADGGMGEGGAYRYRKAGNAPQRPRGCLPGRHPRGPLSWPPRSTRGWCSSAFSRTKNMWGWVGLTGIRVYAHATAGSCSMVEAGKEDAKVGVSVTCGLSRHPTFYFAMATEPSATRVGSDVICKRRTQAAGADAAAGGGDSGP